MKKLIVALAVAVALSMSTSSNAASCKAYSRCEQAVKNWCEGRHSGADRDGDGIPCENVCRSKREVDEIRREIGC